MSSQIDSLPLDDALVSEYLIENPDFFNRHPEVISQLKIPHSNRGAVSLVERQQDILRSKSQLLEEEITRLMATARVNERLFHTFGNLYIQLIAATSVHELEHTLCKVLNDDLNLPLCKLILKQEQLEQQDVVFKRRLGDKDHYFGRLSQEEKQQLFADESAASVALVRLQDKFGVLAIASTDPGHFLPEMDSLLVDQLTAIIVQLLHKLEA